MIRYCSGPFISISPIPLSAQWHAILHHWGKKSDVILQQSLRRCENEPFAEVMISILGAGIPFDPFSDQPQFHARLVPSHTLSTMPPSPAQTTAVNEIINILCTTPAGPRTKRKLGEMFMNLVDKDDLPEYYEVCTTISFRRCWYEKDNFVSRSFKIRSVSTVFLPISRPIDSRTHKPCTTISTSSS